MATQHPSLLYVGRKPLLPSGLQLRLTFSADFQQSKHHLKQSSMRRLVALFRASGCLL